MNDMSIESQNFGSIPSAPKEWDKAAAVLGMVSHRFQGEEYNEFMRLVNESNEKALRDKQH